MFPRISVSTLFLRKIELPNPVTPSASCEEKMKLYLLMTKDIRWQQRFSNYRKALRKLNLAVEIIKYSPESGTREEKDVVRTILKEGLIQRFEYTHELAWSVMKDYAEFQGNFGIKGSRDATREAFKMGLIEDAESWMEMLKSRNLTSHTYNEEITEEIHEQIAKIYQPLFIQFEEKMTTLLGNNLPGIFEKDL